MRRSRYVAVDTSFSGSDLGVIVLLPTTVEWLNWEYDS